jgi:hypothetical protein
MLSAPGANAAMRPPARALSMRGHVALQPAPARIDPAMRRVLTARAAAPPSENSAAADSAANAADNDDSAPLPPPERLEEEIMAMARRALEADPDAAVQVRRYRDAVARLERARAAERQLERLMEDAQADAAREEAQERAAARVEADRVMADAEVAAAERLVRAAEIELGTAQRAEAALRRAAERGADRVESGKAAALAAAGGALAAVPLGLADPFGASAGGLGALAVAAAGAAASCALFGVTYRYAARGGSEASDSHLRAGVVAAFGLVKGAGAAEAMLALERPAAASYATAGAAALFGGLTLEAVLRAALYAGESVLVFAFAAAAVEAGFRAGMVKQIEPPKAIGE